MNLRDFVRESLLQIANGVSDVNERFTSNPTSARANPPGAEFRSRGGTTYQPMIDTQPIEFDVAVTIVENFSASSSRDASEGISVVSACAQRTDEAQTMNANVSRIRFTIPLRLPDAK